MWNSFKTYGHNHQNAFEILCNQLFEHYLRRKYGKQIIGFKVVNGSGGDGGIEAYGELDTEKIIAIQSKWFPTAMQSSHLNQIKKSITTALVLRPNVQEYIICIPREIASIKRGKGKKPVKNSESDRVNSLTREITKLHPNVKLAWWTTQNLLEEMQLPENEGIHRYWFEKEILSFSLLEQRFNLLKTNSWLKERYVPDLHASGRIQQEVDQLLCSKSFRNKLARKTLEIQSKLRKTVRLLTNFKKILPDDHQLSNFKKATDYLQKLDILSDSLIKALQMGNRDFELGEDLPLPESFGPIFSYLHELRPTNVLKNEIFELRSSVNEMIEMNPFYVLSQYTASLGTFRKLILGGPGTGKTHGVAMAVESSLKIGHPALLIRAKTADCSSWTSLLTNALDVPGWSQNELFSTMESLAMANDSALAREQEPGQASKHPKTVALICIDGLEEATFKQDEWYNRISEIPEIATWFPRIKFVFTSRPYFNDNSKGLDTLEEIVYLIGDGDVQVEEVLPKYFAHYRIRGKIRPKVSGLNSLFALRLFCEEYQGQDLDTLPTIETTVRKLLQLKIDRLDKEFIAQFDQGTLVSPTPISDVLVPLSKIYYDHGEMEHKELIQKLCDFPNLFLQPSLAAQVLRFLTENGVLVSYEIQYHNGVIPSYTPHYSMAYQSIMEVLVTESTYQKIKDGNLDELPDFLFRPMIIAPHSQTDNSQKVAPNRQIIESIIARIFHEQGKLIGEDGFLEGRFNEGQLLGLQLMALREAPESLAKKYIPFIKELFFGNYKTRFNVIKELIVPSSQNGYGVFNANWLHNILMELPTVFQRDNLWSDFDKEAMNNMTEYERRRYNSTFRLRHALSNGFLDGSIWVSEYAKYDEFPLVLAWALSSIDRELRENIRTALTSWAIMNPLEYIKLLDKIFHVNDPQIQEDLALIGLGVASRLTDDKSLTLLAEWALKNIFEKTIDHRDIIVRHGFRAMVERAHQFGLVSSEACDKSRPQPLSAFQLLPLDKDYLNNSREEYYPIVHDLAWYVIKRGYEHFLSLENKDNANQVSFFNKYQESHGDIDFYPNKWAMSAAIMYIRNLGLERTKGSWFTEASHGSKSKVYTYEEKYTWLAVHFLLGYLSDYLPYGERIYSTERTWLKDYSIITEISNPAENIFNEETAEHLIEQSNTIWRIREPFVKEVPLTEELFKDIENAVLENPKLHFHSWLFHKDFHFLNKGEHAVSLYGSTTLTNTSETITASLWTEACIITKEDFPLLLELLKDIKDYRLWWSDSIGYQAIPDTYVYSNPTDIVWMDWIEEIENEIFISEDSAFYPTSAKVTRNSTQGEKEVYIPSKKIRHLMDIVDFRNNTFIDLHGNVVGSISEISDGRYRDNQDFLVVHWEKLDKLLQSQGLQIFWFTKWFSRKNPLNENLDRDFYVQRIIKYLLWWDGNQVRSYLFGDKIHRSHEGSYNTQ